MSSSTRQTRSATEDSLFGQLLPTLPKDQLPKKLEIVRHFLYRKDKEFDKIYVRNGKEIKQLNTDTKSKIIKEISEDLANTWWTEANIPVKSSRSIEQNVESLIDYATKELRNKPYSGKNAESADWKETFYNTRGLNQILDIGLCQCFVNVQGAENIILPCKCGNFPVNELEFYKEQKFVRRGKILKAICARGTEELQNSEARKLRKQEKPERVLRQIEREKPNFDTDPSSLGACALPTFDDEDFENEFPDEEFENPLPSSQPKIRNRQNHTNFVSYARRKGIRDHQTLAALINCLRIDDGETDLSKFVSARKIENEWKKLGQNLSKEHSKIDKVICIKFDGKKGLVKLVRGKQTVVEIITCVVEPGGYYLHQFEPEEGTGVGIAQGVFQVVQSYDSEDSLLAIGGDNCATNTGKNDGAFRWIEIFLGKEFSWVCCLLHFIELPLKRLADIHIGKTISPEKRAGELGEALANLPSNRREMVNFKPIKGSIPEDIDDELLTNQDQRYFYIMCLGIQKGPRFLKAKFGQDPPLPSKGCAARWLNDKSAEMRYYIQTEKPSEGLVRLMHVTLNWYGPLFFQIKKESDVSFGAIHFYNAIDLQRKHFTTVEQIAVKSTFERNSFFAHPENILLSGIYHGNAESRVKCAKAIIEARKRSELSEENRQFEVPGSRLNFKAKSFLEMVNIFNVRLKNYVTDPPLLRIFDDDTLMKYAKEGNAPLFNIPCHSVNNERAVKDTSLASTMGVGEEQVHQHILNMKSSRDSIPTKPKKSDFVKKE